MCKSIQFFLAHLLQQGGSHGEGIEDQLVVGHNHGHARMLVQVVRLRPHRQLLAVVEDGVYVLLQCRKRVFKVLK